MESAEDDCELEAEEEISEALVSAGGVDEGLVAGADEEVGAAEVGGGVLTAAEDDDVASAAVELLPPPGAVISVRALPP